MGDYSISWSAELAAGSIAAGQPIVPNDAGTFLLSTLTARTAFGGRRTAGIARSAADTTSNSFDFQMSGLVPSSVLSLGAGTESWVIVNDDGTLSRATPSGSDDIIGHCDTSGRLTVIVGMTAGMVSSGGGSDGAAGVVQTSDGAGSFLGAQRVLAGGTPFGASFVSVQAQAGDFVSSFGAIRLGSNTSDFNPKNSVYGADSFGGSPVSMLFPARTSWPYGPNDYINIGDGSWGIKINAGVQHSLTHIAQEHFFGEGTDGTHDNNPLAECFLRIGRDGGNRPSVEVYGSFGIFNPARTKKYFFVSSAITVDRQITLPLLTADDTMVFEHQSQTLTIKTIDIGANVITDASATVGDIMRFNGTKFVRLQRGAANQVLTVKADGSDIEWR